jgi:3'-5' exoribonuclease
MAAAAELYWCREAAMTTVSEMREGQEFEGALWLVSCAVRQTKNGDPYWEGQLQDATGSVSAKLWDSAGGRTGRVKAMQESLRPGSGLKVRGKVDAYQGTLQLTLLAAEPYPDASAALFSPKSRRPLPEMLSELDAIARGLEDPDYRRLLDAFRSDPALFGPFSEAPAAKAIHHAWVHGLLEHSLQLSRAARSLAPLYPALDLEMVLLGCFFHDAGKAEEISALPGFDYTTDGKLMGHIYMGARLVERLCDSIPGFPPEKRLHLVHLVLSHQGERSEGYGSAADPATAEAIFFHHLDNLDA